jgi:hypothetical protein
MANEYFISDSNSAIQQLQVTSPGWNICDSIRVVVTLRYGEKHLICRKNLTDNHVTIVRQ